MQILIEHNILIPEEVYDSVQRTKKGIEYIPPQSMKRRAPSSEGSVKSHRSDRDRDRDRDSAVLKEAPKSAKGDASSRDSWSRPPPSQRPIGGYPKDKNARPDAWKYYRHDYRSWKHDGENDSNWSYPESYASSSDTYSRNRNSSGYQPKSDTRSAASASSHHASRDSSEHGRRHRSPPTVKRSNDKSRTPPNSSANYAAK